MPDTAVRVLRSMSGTKLEALLPWRRLLRSNTPASGIHEVFGTLLAALVAARRFVYLEDQYLGEATGGEAAFELYPALRAAAERGVKIILVGSGTRDPEDPGFHPQPINRRLNRDLRRKLVDRLAEPHRSNVAVFRVDSVTVHSKLVLVDDEFACIGSANMFSRSMAGTDCELSAAVATTTTVVRDLRVAVWADHLRAPLTPELQGALEDPDVALGLWRASWTPDRAVPAVLTPAASALSLVGPV